MNPVLECLFKHRSIRRYKNQPVEDEKLQLIIKAAQAAPSWCNGEQVSIIVVKDQALKEKLKEYCGGQKYVATCPVFLVFCADFYRVSIAFEKAGKTKEDFEKYMSNIDTLIIGSHDVGICMQNATVAAESFGLGTVDIGAIRYKSLEVTKALNLPKYCIPICGLCIGYPDDDPGLKPRLPPKAICFENKYNVENAKAGVDEYDEIMKKYLAERDSNARDSNWSKSITSAYTGFSISEDYELLKQQGYNCINKK
jgi:FMN reductase [NAD(P)H]